MASSLWSFTAAVCSGGLAFAGEARAEVIVLAEDFGYGDYRPAPGTIDDDTIDAFAATWVVQNSRNDDPTWAVNCDVGRNTINPYPINLQGSNAFVFQGGRVMSEVPQASEWSPTYCNSAALIVRDADDVIVEQIRIEGAWDGVRFADGADDFTLRDAWVSNFRDDAVENDQVRSGRIEDCLFDGGFVGISFDPGGDGGPADSGTQLVVLDHYIQRLQRYPFRDDETDPLEDTHGQLFKGTNYTPQVEIVHSVFAAEAEPFAGDGRLTSVIDQLAHCENNYFLWLGDEPVPAAYADNLPDCFAIHSGQDARDRWDAVKQNWIDCHPDVPRAEDDPLSNPDDCNPTFIDDGMPTTPDEPDPDTTGGADSGSTSSPDSTGAIPESSEGGSLSGGAMGTTTTDADDITSDGSASSGGATDEAAGCSCTASPRGIVAPPLLVLAVAGLTRRRRRGSSNHASSMSSSR